MYQAKHGLKRGLGTILPVFLRCTCSNRRGCLWILSYHDIGEVTQFKNGVPKIGAYDFEKHLRIFGKYFKLRPLSRAIHDLETGCLQGANVTITFDDGDSSFKEVVLPLLKKYDVPATVFVCGSTAANDKPLWGDGLRALWTTARMQEIAGILDTEPGVLNSFAQVSRQCQIHYSDALRDKLVAAARAARNGGRRYLSAKDLEAMPPGLVEIGSHTWSHAPLAAIADAELDVEIGRNHDYLRQFPAFAPTFAIPFGQPRHFRAEQVQHIRKFFGLRVCSSSGGVNRRATDFDYSRIGGDVLPDEMKGHLLNQALVRR